MDWYLYWLLLYIIILSLCGVDYHYIVLDKETVDESCDPMGLKGLELQEKKKEW